jgi:hypothetical protein
VATGGDVGTFDDERAILKDIGMVRDPEVCFFHAPNGKAIAFLSAVRDLPSWTKSERPDLYSDEQQLAIEVMRVDDHPRVGKITNPTLACEAALEREIRAAFPSMNHDIRVAVIANTGLPSDLDHNFTAYREAFARIVGDHSAKVAAYRERHPGYALALLVHDESSAYAQVEEPTKAPPSNGTMFPGRAHYWFLDAYFTRIVAESGADFFFWHTPFKHIWYSNAFGRQAKAELPTLAVYDVATMADWIDQLVYDPSLIVSVEE